MILLQLLVGNGYVTSFLEVDKSFYLWNARNMETIENNFNLLFDKDMFSLIETKANEKIRKNIEVLNKHKYICLKAQSTRE